MTLELVELVRLEMPLVAPFRTSFGTSTARDVLLVHVVTSEAEGWGECVADSTPLYSAEYVDGAAQVIEQVLLPAVVAAASSHPIRVQEALQPFKGHRMAKAALHTAFLDAHLRAIGCSLAEHLGGTRDRVDCGVSVGIMDSIGELLAAVAGYLDQGYRRIKLKIEPGWDVQPVRAVRREFGGEVMCQVDANAAYSLRDARHLARLDDCDLLLIEQPLPEDDIVGHADLARTMRTPICLDESITSTRTAAAAIRLGACQVINIKPGRVGGYPEARRIAELAAAHGLATWCGGMLETGIGRAANLALAALPMLTLPGDTSASDRYFTTDITEPFALHDGQLAVPTGPGIGVEPIPAHLDRFTTSRQRLPLA